MPVSSKRVCVHFFQKKKARGIAKKVEGLKNSGSNECERRARINRARPPAVRARQWTSKRTRSCWSFDLLSTGRNFSGSTLKSDPVNDLGRLTQGLQVTWRPRIEEQFASTVGA
jgi:hypothetical protein